MRSIGRSIAAAVAVCSAAAVLAGAVLPARATGEEEPLVVKVDDGGFRWRDAGIGAVGALAVVLLGAGLVLTVRARGGDDAGDPTSSIDGGIRRRRSGRRRHYGRSAG